MNESHGGGLCVIPVVHESLGRLSLGHAQSLGGSLPGSLCFAKCPKVSETPEGATLRVGEEPTLRPMVLST